MIFMITKLRWSFQHPFWLKPNIYPIDKPAHPTILDIKKETLAFAKPFITLTVCKEDPEPLLTQQDIHILREITDTAEFQMETHTGYYLPEIKKIVHKQSTSKSSFLVGQNSVSQSWWCQHLFLITSGASFLFFSTAGASNVF